MRSQRTRERVVIRTNRLENCNYGGVLQAYALQAAVRTLVPNVATDLSVGPSRFGSLYRAVTAVRESLGLGPITRRDLRRCIDREVLRFIEQNMETLRLFGVRSRPRRHVTATTGTYIVGSDQVWRPEYTDLRGNLLGFLDNDPTITRIAYAASFGTDTPRIDGVATRYLAERFDTVSVREQSGIRLCRELWGVESVRMPDPTVLLGADSYRTLFAGTGSNCMNRGSQPYICSYVLDEAPVMQEVRAEAAREVGLPVVDLSRPEPSSVGVFRRDPERYIRPSVEQWLQTIDGSSLVVTDSFHGCAFAIIMEKPFVAVGNRERGLARFETLLGTYALTDRLVDPREMGRSETSRRVREAIGSSIDWERVGAIRDEERRLGLAFLRTALRGMPSGGRNDFDAGLPSVEFLDSTASGA